MFKINRKWGALLGWAFVIVWVWLGQFGFRLFIGLFVVVFLSCFE